MTTYSGRKNISEVGYKAMISTGKQISGDCISIIFKDDGNGISDEHIKNIFEPFFTTRENGTGLGLAITKRIIESHDGAIDVYSAIGEGAAFVIVLPVIIS